MDIRQPQQRMASARAFPATNQLAEYVLDFGPRAPLDVPQHRGHHGGAGLCHRGVATFQSRLARREARLVRDFSAFVEHLACECGPICTHDITERCPHEAGEAGHGGDEDPFFPHFLKNRRAQRQVEPCA